MEDHNTKWLSQEKCYPAFFLFNLQFYNLVNLVGSTKKKLLKLKLPIAASVVSLVGRR
jgi:hypothetical protein